MMKPRKQNFIYLSFILLPIVIWFLLSHSGLLNGFEEQTIRWRYLARGEIESTAPILFVNLDAETVSFMGDRPWDRREFGVLLNAILGQGNARVVAVDIILSKFGAGALLDIKRARKGDAFLGQALERYADRVVLAAAYTGVKQSTTNEFSILPMLRDGHVSPETVPFPEAPTYPIIQFGVGRLGLANVDEILSRGVIPYFVPGFVQIFGPRYSFHLIDGALRQKEAFMTAPFVEVQGDEVVLNDADGWVTERLPMHYELTLYTLGLEAFLAGNELTDDSVEIDDDSLRILKAGSVFREIPLVQGQSIEANWFHGWGNRESEAHISMQTVLKNANALALASRDGDARLVAELSDWFRIFENKVVFVGPVDPQLKDLSPTPFNFEPVPKVGLHANIFRTIHDERYIRRGGPIVNAVSLGLLTIFVSGFALGRGKLRSISLLLFVFYVFLTFFAFSQFDYILPFVAPVGAAMTALVSIVLLRLGSEEWQRRRIKNLFGAYVAPKLVDEMIESKQDPQLGGAEAAITALFSDVEGFSALSEELGPNQLVSLMNEYLSAMTEVFQAQSGTLDKYIGDAIVTMFGMPVPVTDHASRACVSAIAMQERHAELRAEWRDSGKWPESVWGMRMRIGLNTGTAVIGNMGSDMRFNYTMMGDVVNLAARCESGAKIYGVYTMVTAETLDAALSEGTSLFYRKLDRVVVKGRRSSVNVYELWEPSIMNKETEQCRELYERALQLYIDGDWSAALEIFTKSAGLEPRRGYAPTTPSNVLSDRCRILIQEGDRANWDGVFRMKKK